MNLPLLFAARYLAARKSHNVINLISGISVVGMAVGTAALIIILSVFNGFGKIVDASFTDADADIVIRPARGKVFVPYSAAFDRIAAFEEVFNMCEVLEDEVFISNQGSQVIASAKGVDRIFEEESPLRGHISEGQFMLRNRELRFCLPGRELARKLGLSPRYLAKAEIYYPDRNAGISAANPLKSLRNISLPAGGTLTVNSKFDDSVILVPLESMRELLDYEEEVSSVEIRLTPGLTAGKKDRLRKDISTILGPEFKVLDRYMQNESLYKMMRYEKLAVYLILLFVIIIIAFNIYGSLTMLIIEKEDDIQTLRSLGAPEAMTGRIFLLEGWLISLIGLAAGIIIGVAFVLLQSRFGFISMPGNFAMTAYPVVLKASDILWTAGGVALIGYLIALIPVIKHNRI